MRRIVGNLWTSAITARRPRSGRSTGISLLVNTIRKKKCCGYGLGSLLPLHILISCMRYRYFRPASRLFAGQSVPSRSSDALHARFSQVVFCDRHLHPRPGSQSGRPYSQTNAQKPPQKSTKTDTRRSVDTPVTPSRRSPDTHPRDSRDRSTRPPLPAHDQQASQSSSSTAFSPPGSLPGGSGSDSLFSSTTSPLLGAALTTIVGLGLGALCFIPLISDIMSWQELACIYVSGLISDCCVADATCGQPVQLRVVSLPELRRVQNAHLYLRYMRSAPPSVKDVP